MLKNIWQCYRISDECVPFQAGVSRVERVCSISGVYVPFQLVCPISGECVPFQASVSHSGRVCPILGGCVPFLAGVFHIGRVCPISGCCVPFQAGESWFRPFHSIIGGFSDGSEERMWMEF